MYPYTDKVNYTYPEQMIYQQLTFDFIYDFDDHWVYQFYEIPKSIETAATIFYTNRTINVTWACRDYNVVEGGDGMSINITYDDNGDRMSLPVGSPEPNSTTYIIDTNVTCGTRCARVWGFQATKVRNETGINSQVSGPRLFDCNITISGTDNAYLDAHQLDDDRARLAASAIGRQDNPNASTSLQWRRYPEGCVCSNAA